MEITVKNSNENASVNLTEHPVENGIGFVDVSMDFDAPTAPKKVIVSWEWPCVDAWSIFSPQNKYERNIAPGFRMRVTPSRLASGAPVQQIISSAGRNRLTLALSDAMTPVEIAMGVRESKATIKCEVRFFTEQCDPISHYEARIYLDYTDRRYDASLKAVERWWAEECGYPSAHVPPASRECVYSTWYSFHQDFTADAIINQCRLAKPLGMNVLIMDDGWQCNNGGYKRDGDWIPYAPKIPSMRECVSEVHKIGMKFVLWVHLPAMGVEAEHYEQFKDMLLDPSGRTCPHMDPRFPQVREYLVNTLVGNARDWKLDGYKLDYIDWFKHYPDTKEFDERWDTLSIDEGVDMLMSALTKGLREYDPDFMIEFRQSYTGPVIRKYGNMIRVGDCPEDSMRNHTAGTDLRLLLGRTAVHSDMLMWNLGDTLEAASMQVISTLFLVPQISVLLDKIPEDHLSMLRFYLAFRNAHVNTLLDGEFTAENPEQCYSLIQSTLGDETIAVSKTLNVYRLEKPGKLWIVNATAGGRLYVDHRAGSGIMKYTVYAPTGDVTGTGCADFSADGVDPFDVPRAGMIEFIPA